MSIFQLFKNNADKYEAKKDDNWYLNFKDNEGDLYNGSLIEKVKVDNLTDYKILFK